MFDVRRRQFITLLGGAAAWPLSTRAQQPAVPVIGWLGATTAEAARENIAAFQHGSAETSYVVGRNVAIEYRWAEGRYDRLPALAADLVGRQVAVIVAAGGNAPARAAEAATTKIPIVFIGGGDPVSGGLVASFNRPGGNVTGVSWIVSALEAKRLGLLLDVVPRASEIAVLVNPIFPAAETQLKNAQQAAQERGFSSMP
jgi:putative ABC transport system substrate-binding protein